ncbi:MAG: hypothetical protein EOO65_05205 [Methanosarcinales archaeon]|nr:MAG: hypothetical protein EOO65_05205 [Methanosarcinales archaeon]
MQIWDTRRMDAPVAQLDAGGGVWRIKWCPLPQRNDLLLLACMHAGFKIVRQSCSSGADGRLIDTCAQTEEGSEAAAGLLSVVAHHTGHASLAYGVDWLRTPVVADAEAGAAHPQIQPLIGSCSFYDHLLHSWQPTAAI